MERAYKTLAYFITALFSLIKKNYNQVIMKTILTSLFITFVFTYSSTPAQVSNVEHFYISSPDAEKLYHFFKEEFQLPTVWSYNNWGSWASGGLMLGNTPLEFLKFAKDTSIKTFFAGIALEPTARVNKLKSLYDSLHLSYGKMYVDTFTENGIKDTGFINLKIKKTLPDNIYFFTCDYKYRGEMDTMEMRASDSLKTIQGGTLGIIALKEIVVGCNDVSAYSNELSKLPGIKQHNNLFSFSKGPSIQLVKADNEGIQKIIVRVRSVIEAKMFLQQRKILGTVINNSIMINPAYIDGLKIELTDNIN